LTNQKVENVVRIVMREEGRYTLFVQELGSDKIQEKRLQIMAAHRSFIADVPKGANPWILLKRDKDGWIWFAEFHVRSIDDLGAGGYMTGGKYPRPVQPQVIQ
jgi:hypothetical protein